MSGIFVVTKDNKINVLHVPNDNNPVALYIENDRFSNKFDARFNNGSDIADSIHSHVIHKRPEIINLRMTSINELRARVPDDSYITGSNGSYLATIKYIAMPGSLLDIVSELYDGDIKDKKRTISDLKKELSESKRECDSANRALTEQLIKNDSLLDVITEKNKIIDGPINTVLTKVKRFFKNCG